MQSRHDAHHRPDAEHCPGEDRHALRSAGGSPTRTPAHTKRSQPCRTRTPQRIIIRHDLQRRLLQPRLSPPSE